MNAARKAKPIHVADPTEYENPFVGGYPEAVLDSEGVFLSACLLQPKLFRSDLSQLLRPEHFYSTANQHVFEAMLVLDRHEDTTFDVVLVANYMRDHGTLKQSGGSPYLATLCDAQPATLNPGQHAAAIREAWKRRELFKVMARCATLLRNNEASHEDCYGELKEHFREMRQ
jgi:replicative DNA helicase